MANWGDDFKIELMDDFPLIDPLNFPTNERKFNVSMRLEVDCRDSEFLNIISGYSGLDQVILFIAKFAKDYPVKLVFGHEPSMIGNKKAPASASKLPDEMRDYWLNLGLSPRTNSSVLECITAIKSGRVEARIHTERFLHAKAYITSNAAIFGSSNFSKPGLEGSRELNGRHEAGSEGYNQVKKFSDGCWDRSKPYTMKLLQLLEQLLLHSTWREALARSCAAILEGDWAEDMIPRGLKAEYNKLWPHQKQGIAQAMSVLENQGAVVISDPTGSGKTRTGGWLFRLAQNKMISRGGEMATSLIPVIVSPSSVENNWHQIMDQVGVSAQVLPMGLLSNPGKESSKRRLKLLEKAGLIGVDEIHNFYNLTTNRTQRLSGNLAESRIFLTATPINRNFKDLVRLMNLLGTADLDGDTFLEIRRLEDSINDNDRDIRDNARKRAKKLVQRFMVRRTRDDLCKIAKERPDEYRIGERVASYPQYNPEYYLIDSPEDYDLLELIEQDVNRLRGLSRIKKIKQTNYEKEHQVDEKNTLKARLSSSRGMNRWLIWNTLDSSVVALYEHILGTKSAEEEYEVDSRKTMKSKSKGVLNQLKEMMIPQWELSEELINDSATPRWIVDEEQFELVRKEEISLYESILDKISQISNSRINSKLDLLENTINDGNKVLAFDSSIITIEYLKKELIKREVEVHSYTGASNKTKKKRVLDAEGLFGLHSDRIPRIGLLSDSMSEGINLQGTSILVHLTEPSTIRKAEQRAGRVDRMDSPLESITIYYPKKDLISSKKSDLLGERLKLVNDVLGSNIKLPDEETEDIPTEEEIDLNSQQINEKMFSDRDGLFDAFFDVRNLIGDSGIISDNEYELMRTSKARVLSYVGLVESETPWCFFVIQTNKNWTPQWVFLDYEKRAAKAGSGIVTDIADICKLLREHLQRAEDLDPSINADEWIEKYLEHVSRHEVELLPKRRRSMLVMMKEVLLGWEKYFKNDSETIKKLRDLRFSIIRERDGFDLRQMSSQWMSFIRDRKTKNLKDRISGRGKTKKFQNLLIENPPEDIENFLAIFEEVEYADIIDSRTIAMIAGVPKTPR